MVLSIQAYGNRKLLAATGVGCVVLLFWLATALGEVAFDALIFALVGTVLLGASLWLCLKGIEEAVDYRALRSLEPSRRKPGDWVAVALDGTIKATLSGREALACHYEVIEKQESIDRRSFRTSGFLLMLCEGHHLVPTGIETGSGAVPLRALPDLVNLDKSAAGFGESRLDETAEPANPRDRHTARARLAARKQDRFDIDWKYRDARSDTQIIRKEWVLPPGEQVCVFGRWEEGALTPSPMRPRGLPVYAGTPEDVQARLGGGSKVFFVLGALPFLVVAWWGYSIAA